MYKLEIYTTDGSKINADDETFVNKKEVTNLFFREYKIIFKNNDLLIGNVRELIYYFQARSSGSRSEQYYAYFVTDSEEPFREFKKVFNSRIEQENWKISDEYSSQIDFLNAINHELPGSRSQHDKIDNLLRKGNRLRLGVSTLEDAVSVIEFHRSADVSFAITFSPQEEHPVDFDITIVIKPVQGLQLIDRTSGYKNKGEKTNSEKYFESSQNFIFKFINMYLNSSEKSKILLRIIITLLTLLFLIAYIDRIILSFITNAFWYLGLGGV